MVLLAAPLIAAAAGVLAETRTFWRPQPGVGLQPAQVQVATHLVHVGDRVAVYQQDDYSFARLDRAPEAGRVAALAATFEDTVLPRVESLVGPCPDMDGNGKLLLVVTALPDRPARSWRYDLMSADAAASYGFRSNEGEVLFTTMEYEGNRSRLNLHFLAAGLVEMLNAARAVTAPAGWSELAAAYTPYALGLAPARHLWGDYPPDQAQVHVTDPIGDRGWSLLFFHYLTEKLGSQALRVAPDGLPEGLGASGAPDTGTLLADYAMACWLDDPAVGDGRYSLASIDPPRPEPSVRAVASRPTSGVVQVGVGGFTFIAVEGSEDRSFPLTLQGDRAARWSARAVVQRQTGPYEEVPAQFNDAGLARIALPQLGPQDRAVIAVAAVPTAAPGADRRSLPLLWGVGWVPHTPPDPTRSLLAELVGKALPDGGATARARLQATLARLGGLQAEAQAAPGLTANGEPAAAPRPVTTRYAWAPQAAFVADVIVEEAGRRGLQARAVSFPETASNAVAQQWRNVIVEVPGTDQRRWPVVLAAHWDAARSTHDESLHDAVGLNENAAGVAVGLEVAAALTRTPHRAPVLVAFLAGGHHDAAGARALLAELRGKASAWVELEAIGVPNRAPWGLWVRIEGEHKLSRIPFVLGQSLKVLGLVGRPEPTIASPHCGAAAAAAHGIPSVVVRARTDERTRGDIDTPLEAEQAQLSEDLMVLVARAVTATLADLAGSG